MKKILLTLGIMLGITLFLFAFTVLRGNNKVTICHIPPGNPDNAHEITVSENAIPAHLAHGDHIGECECIADPNE